MALKLPIIVPTCEIGRLGNVLLSGAHNLAFCLEHDLYFTHLWFEKYANDFPATRYSLFCSHPSFPWFPVPRSWRGWMFNLGRLIKRFIGAQRNELPPHVPEDIQEPRSSYVRVMKKICKVDINMAVEVRMDGDDFFEKIRDCWLVNLRGWRYRAPNLVEKHAAAIRAHFRPSTAILSRVQEKIQSCRAGADVLVGVHIRQTDYKIWRGGAFFYEPEIYLQLMRHVLDLFPGQNVKFLICSDQLPDAIAASEFLFERGPGTALEDLYALSQCDFIVGPPSSFSLWASFYGNKPLYHLEKAGALPGLSDFSPETRLIWKFDGL